MSATYINDKLNNYLFGDREKSNLINLADYLEVEGDGDVLIAAYNRLALLTLLGA